MALGVVAAGVRRQIDRRGRQPAPAVKPATRQPSALVAAASVVNLKDSSSWQMFRLGDRRWQQEAWRHYDSCGELRFVAGWIGQAVSRCTLYAADVDDDGNAGNPTEDQDAAQLARDVFTNAAGRAEAFRLITINLTVAGECYIVIEGTPGNANDKWYVASTTEVRRRGDEIAVTRSMIWGGGTYTLDPTKDILIRVWTPHPRVYDAADSTVRAVLPVLREIEQSTKRVFAEIDSRLAGAGILFVPESLDFPRAEGQTAEEGLSEALQRVAATSLTQRDSAAAVVPLIVAIADDLLGKINPVYFDSKMSDMIMGLREKAIERLAASLDIPPEVLKGMGKSSHWNAWQVEESTIKIHIEPVLIRIADALNVGYFYPGLKASNRAEQAKYTLWFDVSALAVRPNRSDQALQFQEKGLLSDEATRTYADFNEDDAPDEDEVNVKWLRQLILAAPALIGDPEVQKMLGLPNIQMPAPPAPPAAPTDPGVDPNAIDQGLPNYDADGNIIPPTSSEPADAGNKALPTTATSTTGIQSALFFASDSAVRRALELAGGRLVPGRDRQTVHRDVPRHELHTRVWVDPQRQDSLLAGAFTHIAEQAPMLHVDGQEISDLLDAYCRRLMNDRRAHDPALLRAVLAEAMR